MRRLENSRSKELIYHFPFISPFPSNRSHLHIPKTETSCISTLPPRYVVSPLCSSSPLCGCSSSFLCLIFQVSLPVLFCPHRTLLNGKFLHILHTHTHTHPFSPPSHSSTKECPPLFTSHSPASYRASSTLPSHWPSGFRNVPPSSQHTTSATLNRSLCGHKRCRHLHFPYFLLLHFVSHFSNFFSASFLFISSAPAFSFAGSFPQSHPPPPNPPRAWPVNSGRQSRAAD